MLMSEFWASIKLLIFSGVGSLFLLADSWIRLSRFWIISNVSQGSLLFSLWFKFITFLAASLHDFSKFLYIVFTYYTVVSVFISWNIEELFFYSITNLLRISVLYFKVDQSKLLPNFYLLVLNIVYILR